MNCFIHGRNTCILFLLVYSKIVSANIILRRKKDEQQELYFDN